MISIGRTRAFTLLDLILLLLLIALLFGAVLPAIVWLTHGFHRRIRCESNLRQFGQAIMLYAVDNAGHFPRTTYVPGAPPTAFTGALATDPFGKDGPSANDVTAAMFLVLRTQDISPEVLVCAWDTNADAAKARRIVARNAANFADATVLSYSLWNPYPRTEQAPPDSNKLNADLALMADMNPGPAALQLANSFNHDGEGQNVLHGDGHVQFHDTPRAGVDRDNIFTFGSGGKKGGEGIEGAPASADDSVLLPARLAGYAPPKRWEPEQTEAVMFAASVLCGVTLIVCIPSAIARLRKHRR